MFSSMQLIPDILTGGATLVRKVRRHNGELVQTAQKVSAEQIRKLKTHPKKVRLKQECVRCTDLIKCIDSMRASVEARKPIPNKRLIEMVEWIKLYNTETEKRQASSTPS